MMRSMADSQPPVQVLGAPHPLFYATADRLINNIHGYANYNNYMSWSNVAHNNSSSSNSDSEVANEIGCAGALSLGPLRPLGIDHTETNTNNNANNSTSTSKGTSSGRRAGQLMQQHSLRSCNDDVDIAEEASSSDNTSHRRHPHHNKQRGDEKYGDEAGSWLQLGLATQPDYESTTMMMRMRPSTSCAARFTHVDLHLATPPAANSSHNHATAIPTFLSPGPSLHHHHHHHHHQTTWLSAGAPSLSASLMQSWPAGPAPDFRIIHPPPPRPHSGLWFMLQASQHQGREPFLPQLSKSFLRIKDGRMTVRLVMKYIANKLGLDTESEVEIKCRGQTLVPILTLQHVRDIIWSPRDAGAAIMTLPTTSASTPHVMLLHYGRIAGGLSISPPS